MKEDTKLAQLGRGLVGFEGTVNLPVYRASTVLSANAEAYERRFDEDALFSNVTYGANGTQNARALSEAIAAIENAEFSIVTASGLSAISMTLSTLLSAGDHLLMTDSTYGPTRRFCDEVLARYGVETTYYDPTDDEETILASIRSNTRLLYMEAPGSLTFEMQDIPSLSQIAKEHHLISVMDNTWATPLAFKPLDHGVDVSIQAGTKYISGHSDLVIGFISVNSDKLFRKIFSNTRAFGDVCGPDDCYLSLRGLRTLSIRLQRHGESALTIATWLSSHQYVERVLYPPLSTDPGHAIWKRDFSGGASLFGLILKDSSETAVKRFIDNLNYFHIGSSWGGYESLVSFSRLDGLRSATKRWNESTYVVRLHIGLEDPFDLQNDLEQALTP